MHKSLINIYILFISITLFCSCKKDKLHFDKVITLHSNTTDRLNAILVSGNTIYAVGGERFDRATIIISRDAGNNWQAINLPQAGKALYGIADNGNGRVYACGFDAKLLWSSDEGHNWNFVQMSNWQPFKRLAFVEPNKAIAVMGVSYNSGGRVFIDAAGSILRWDSTATEYNDIVMADANTGYISGYGVVMKTTDGGNNWSFQNIKNDNFTALSMLNKDNLWTCGVGGSIYHTTDGGNNWERKRNGNNLTKAKYHLHDLLFIDNNTGWCVGEGGVVIYTKDGGKTWSEYETFTHNILRSIALLPDGNLLVCGDYGSMYKLER
jgi:photosystem II stability/assembly factor-like uncharacterized protein